VKGGILNPRPEKPGIPRIKLCMSAHITPKAVLGGCFAYWAPNVAPRWHARLAWSYFGTRRAERQAGKGHPTRGRRKPAAGMRCPTRGHGRFELIFGCRPHTHGTARAPPPHGLRRAPLPPPRLATAPSRRGTPVCWHVNASSDGLIVT